MVQKSFTERLDPVCFHPVPMRKNSTSPRVTLESRGYAPSFGRDWRALSAREPRSARHSRAFKRLPVESRNEGRYPARCCKEDRRGGGGTPKRVRHRNVCSG